jgi:YesN/AraC family two-component response regulator
MSVVVNAGIFTNSFAVLGIFAIIWTATVILIFLLRPEIYEGIGVLAPIRLKSSKETAKSFSESEKAQLFKELVTFIESDSTYLDSGLTLKQLSDALKTNQSYLSRAINGIAGRSFLEFINSYRIKYAEELLGSGSISKYTIEGIARASGFRSKSAFYNYFKKYNGMSPLAYIERQKRSGDS